MKFAYFLQSSPFAHDLLITNTEDLVTIRFSVGDRSYVVTANRSRESGKLYFLCADGTGPDGVSSSYTSLGSLARYAFSYCGSGGNTD